MEISLGGRRIGVDMKAEACRRLIFAGLVLLSFLAVLIYNIFTPAMTDDLSYGSVVAGADSLWDLLRQEQYQYMTWTGRSVGSMILRCFLKGDKWIFNICNSLVFVLLTLFMYYNIERKKKYDVFVYLLVNLFVWTFAVSFAQTVLWETGACHYLWGSAIIMGYISAVRYCMQADYAGVSQIAPAVGLFLAGLVAGWCNENTSGGCILLTGIWVAVYVWKNRRVRAWMILGLLGNLTGFLFMTLAPGNANRMQYMEEEHTGWLAVLSRWLKINLAVRDNLFLLIAICIVTFILVRQQQAEWERSRNMGIFFLVSLATCYALVLTPEPVVRVYFGASIFMMVASIQGIVDVADKDLYLRTLKLGATAIFSLYFVFTYMDSGANVIRVYRESSERFAYIEEQKAAGNMDITVPLLRPEFENKYTDAYKSELSSEDSGYWVNVAYATYYGVNSISAVPREEWEAMK